MEELDTYRQELLSALEGVVKALSKTLASISTHAWLLSYGQDTHTPHYTLAHLRELEEQVFSLQLCRILEEDSPVLPIFDDKAWMAGHYDPGKPARLILEEFTHLRTQEVNGLRALPSEGWSRIARHPWWGVHTLQWWVGLQLDYSHQHLKELAAFLAM